MGTEGRFGARVYLMDGKTVLVYQTVRRGAALNAPYVVDGRGKQKGAFLALTDDAGIANAVRAALSGTLS